MLDGRRRRGLRVTLILDPAVALVAWAHLAPPISDNFRKTYRQLLRWNDELPFAKFSVSEDERPMLTLETAADGLDCDGVGRLFVRALAIADLVLDDLLALSGDMKRRHAQLEKQQRDPAGIALLNRYGADLADLTATEP